MDKEINPLDKDLQAALRKRALGYEYKEEEIISGKDGKNPRVKVTRKHMPPDIKAIRMLMLLDGGLEGDINDAE